MKKLFALILATIPFLAACNWEFHKPTDQMNALNEMQQTDVDFSNRSKEAGMKQAFLEYMEDEAVLLRQNRLPLVGAFAVDYLSSIEDSSFSLTWEPQGADMSRSGDLGFTYGIYSMQINDSTYKGTYVTIWRKQNSGKWKMVLDTGNQGIGKDQE